MVRRVRGPKSRSERVSHTTPGRAWWSLLALVAVAGLLGLAWLNGMRPIEGHGVVGSIGRTLRQSAVAIPLATLLALLATASVRRLWLARLERRPGAISVPPFAAPKELEGRAQPLTLMFRNRLAELHMSADVATQPGTTAGATMLDLVGSASWDPKHVLATVAAFVRAAIPSHAYEVRGTLRERAGAAGGRNRGVTVQVVVLPKMASSPQTCWASTWERAVEEAAHVAAAFIVPRTRLCRRVPWTSWEGFVMPAELMDNYERGAARLRERRYEEALGHFDVALSCDPMNLNLRLRVGLVQEQLGLYLDALDTYESMRAIMRPAGEGLPRGLYGRRARGRRRAALESSGHRAAILLGGGQLARWWLTADAWPPNPGRDAEREAIRDRLRARLEAQIAADADRRLLAQPRSASCDGGAHPRCHALEAVFQKLAIARLVELEHAIGPVRSRHGRRTVTVRAVRMSRECVALRLEQTTARLRGDRWRPALATVQELDRRREAVLGRHGRRTWEEHYAAACLYAIALADRRMVEAEGGPDLERAQAQLAERAVGELQRACARADSGYIASQRWWLVSEDPDLIALRCQPAFERFEATYFPSKAPTVRRNEDVRLRELRQHTQQLLLACAQRLADLWSDRAERLRGGHGLDEAPTWWAAELEAWELVGGIARDYRHWQTRLRLIERLHAWSMVYGLPDFEPRYPEVEHLEEVSEIEPRIGNAAMLHGAVTRHLEAVQAWVRAQAREGRRLTARDLALLARRQAAFWQALGEFVEGQDAAALEERLAELLRSAERERPRGMAVNGGRRHAARA